MGRVWLAAVACVSLSALGVAWVASDGGPPGVNVPSPPVPLVMRPKLYSVGDWYSEQCMHHFSKPPGALNLTGGSGSHRPVWYSVPRRTTRDDLCKEGRVHGFYPPRAAQEVAVVDALRLIYVPIRKVASSTIRAALNKAFMADLRWCLPEGGHIEACGVIVYADFRCTSLCLSSKHSDYFVFSFVRNPLTRGYSQLEFVMGPAFNNLSGMGQLEMLKLGQCGDMNHHYESQARSLSTALPMLQEGSEVQHELTFDFIGRVEQLAEDMQKVVDMVRSGLELRRDLDDTQRRRLQGQLDDFMERIRHDHRNRVRNSSRLESARNPALDAVIKDAYSQDCACFGCPPIE